MIISQNVQKGLSSGGRYWIIWGHPCFTTSPSSTKISSWLVRSHSHCILSGVHLRLWVTRLTWRIGKWMLPVVIRAHERQSAITFVLPLVYSTSKWYGMVFLAAFTLSWMPLTDYCQGWRPVASGLFATWRCDHRGNGETFLWPNSLWGPQVWGLHNFLWPM